MAKLSHSFDNDHSTLTPLTRLCQEAGSSPGRSSSCSNIPLGARNAPPPPLHTNTRCQETGSPEHSSSSSSNIPLSRDWEPRTLLLGLGVQNTLPPPPLTLRCRETGSPEHSSFSCSNTPLGVRNTLHHHLTLRSRDR